MCGSSLLLIRNWRKWWTAENSDWICSTVSAVIKSPCLRCENGKRDIPLLVPYFLQRIEEENDKPIYGVSEEVLKLFQEYNWPGNVRELETASKARQPIPRRGDFAGRPPARHPEV